MHQTMAAPQSVTIRNAGDFAVAMRDACGGGEDIALDCAALEELDLSFVQIVEAARVELLGAGKALSLSAPADGPLAALLQRAGFLADPADLPTWLKGTQPQ